MSNTFKILYKIIKSGDTTHILNLHDWAESELNYKDFCEFYEAMQRHQTLIEKYTNDGLIKEKNLIQKKLIVKGFDWDSNATRDRELLFNIGIEYIFNDQINIQELDLDSEFQHFLDFYNKTAIKTLAKKVFKKK